MPFPLLLAQGNAPAASAGGEYLSLLVTFVPLVLLFYLIVIRPQQQQERKRRAMIDALKPNDEVVTTAGIYGTVVRIDPEKDRVVLRVADNVRMTFARSSIAQVLSAAEREKEKEREKAAESA
jgi:preprotein translocase subunit YajC